jgi:AhpD family alkylhydroperoxidase
MSPALLRTALRRSMAQIRYVRPVPPGAAQGLVADVYAQVEADFGMLAPPVALHSPAPGPLAACWLMLRETLVASGLADRAAREAVAAAVSIGNACPYCVAVHNAVLGGLAHGQEAAAIAGDSISSIADPAWRDLAAWARRTGDQQATLSGAAPFPADQLPELAGVAVTFHYLNRMVTIFLQDSPLPGPVPAVMAGGMMRVLGRFLRPGALRVTEPGASLGLLPEAPLPAELRWAAGRPPIAEAFARASAAIETAGARGVPAPVRELVLGELADWGGQPRGPSRSWADNAARQLPPAERPAAKMALLTAFAPYQIGPADIGELRDGEFADREIIELASWASLAAARRVGSWLGEMTCAPGA